ncbi:hypothetical protein [Sphingobium sp. HWE2-09]|uniref:hypothetical protein n=1 Tax=Sphingobium sp. HWE2-09 TaxID=3108390 RepID=UPI00403E60B5
MMTYDTSPPQAQTVAGVANAEKGLVILDGPDGVAVTMTPEAALKTGESLIAAAAAARDQRPDDTA